MSVIVPFEQSKAQLTVMIAVGGALEGAVVHLYTNALSPNIDTKKEDFVEATFDGYVVKPAITWGTVFRNENGQAQTVGNTHTFVQTGPNGDIIQGYYCLKAAALIFSEKFPNPVSLDAVDKACVMLPNYTLGSV